MNACAYMALPKVKHLLRDFIHLGICVGIMNINNNLLMYWVK